MARGQGPVKPPVLRLSEMENGQCGDFFALLAERSRSLTRDGKQYYTCRFRDAKRTATYMVWLDSGHYEECEKYWKKGDFFKIRATFVEDERYGPQIIDVLKIRHVTDKDREEGFNEADFLEHSRFDPALMFTELRTLVEQSITNGPLRQLILHLLDTHRERLLILPGSQRHYHPFVGGWLEHTLSVTRNALHLTEHYQAHYPHLQPPLNRDLIVAGAVCHDLGRLLELDAADVTDFSIDGRLFGHLFLGRDLVRDAARAQGNVDPELLRLLEHLIISHLSLPEWGSPRLPAIPEVLIIHHADDLDVKMEMFVRCLTRDTAEGPFTERDPILGRPLLKERKF